MVLSRETGYTRSYGNNPYAGYDDINNTPFLYDGPTPPGQLLPMARVLTVELNGEAVAYPIRDTSNGAHGERLRRGRADCSLLGSRHGFGIPGKWCGKRIPGRWRGQRLQADAGWP